MADPLDADTLPSLSSDGRARGGSAPRVPCATIAYHHDLRRLGERALLPPRRGAPHLLSRRDLDFVPPGGGEPRPLGDPHLSRSPIALEARPDGSLALEVGDVPAVRCDGSPASGTVRFDAAALERGVRLELAKRAILFLHRAEIGAGEPRHAIDGDSPAISALRRAIGQVADLGVPVLVEGETGVGKERVARALHDASGREGPCVTANVATISRATAASELFGHARGAFTGAERAHRGMFERAHGGTLFLDEIGELGDDVQAMLLRVLETGTFTPLGAEQERAVDVRLVTATDADLDAMAAGGRLRPALLHRLRSYVLRVPPLRARREDIPALFGRLLAQELEAVGEAHRLVPSPPDAPAWLHRSFVERLLAHPWPGNVRQLRNATRQLVVASRGHQRAIVDPWLDRQLADGERAADAVHAPADGKITEADALAALEQTDWSFGAAARLVGVPRSTFYRLVEAMPGIRSGAELSGADIAASAEAHARDLDAMARALKVSRRALRRRMRDLGIETP